MNKLINNIEEEKKVMHNIKSYKRGKKADVIVGNNFMLLIKDKTFNAKPHPTRKNIFVLPNNIYIQIDEKIDKSEVQRGDGTVLSDVITLSERGEKFGRVLLWLTNNTNMNEPISERRKKFEYIFPEEYH